MLQFTETVLRDANQSLAATRMTTDDFAGILDEIDKAGFYSVECWGGATFDSCLRYLHEDPWERLRFLRKNLPNTKLQMLLRGQNLLGYTHYPKEVVREFIELSIKNGIDIIRIFDALNDLDNINDSIEATLDFGGHPSCALCYTTSPVHSIKGFTEQAKMMEKMGARSICIKDMSGCLMPNKAYELVSELKAALSVPVILHTHNSSGMAAMTCYEAIQAGVDVIDTAISCFSGGTSQASTQTMALVAKELGRDPQLNFDSLEKMNVYFKNVFDKYIGASVIDYHSMQTDTKGLITQVPGGMYSNLLSQLKGQGIMDRLDEVLAEVPKVREDLGFPPLVTPISQMVGTQAVANVVAGERYKVVLNEVKAYILGKYGKAPGKINPEIAEKIKGPIGNPTEVIPENKDNDESADQNTSGEERMTRLLFPRLAKEFYSEPAKNNIPPGYYVCREHADNGSEGKMTKITASEENENLYALFVGILANHLQVPPKLINIKNVYRKG